MHLEFLLNLGKRQIHAAGVYVLYRLHKVDPVLPSVLGNGYVLVRDAAVPGDAQHSFDLNLVLSATVIPLDTQPLFLVPQYRFGRDFQL